MRAEAPLLHDDVASYAGAPLHVLATDGHNGHTRLTWAKGDVGEGWRQAEVMLEHAFFVPSRHQGDREPLTSVLALDHDGRSQSWCASKAPFRARVQLAQALGLREEHIRVHVVAVGGKGDARDLPVAYLLAKMARRPVNLVLSDGEERTASHPTHPTVVTIRSGVSRDGRLTARPVRTVHASGADGAMKPRVIALHLPRRGRGLPRAPHGRRMSPGVYHYHARGVLSCPWGAPIHRCPRGPSRPAGPGTGDGPGGLQAAEPGRSERRGRRSPAPAVRGDHAPSGVHGRPHRLRRPAAPGPSPTHA
jgi:CO/xanthine dehydrogenase Mo-binding subunit